MFVAYIQLTKEVKFYSSGPSNLSTCPLNTLIGAGLPFFPHPEHSQCRFRGRRGSGCRNRKHAHADLGSGHLLCCLSKSFSSYGLLSVLTGPLLVRHANNSRGDAAEASTHGTLVPASCYCDRTTDFTTTKGGHGRLTPLSRSVSPVYHQCLNY